MEKRSIFSSGSYSLKLRGVNRMCFSFWGGGRGVFVWRIFYGVENLETSIVGGFFKIGKYIMLEYWNLCI